VKYDEETSLYENDVAILKDYKIMRKITLHRSIRKKGFEIEETKRARGTVSLEKMMENIKHTKSRIFELAYCNEWEHFITLTISPERYDRKNLKKYYRELVQWLTNYNKKHGTNIKYLLIPEMHADGSWHMHGFLMGLPESNLEINKNGFLDWPEYREKFGYCSIDKIKNHEAVAKYITKYISKDLASCVKDLNAHMYYCSLGLNRAQEIKRGTLLAENVPWGFENEWIKLIWSDESSSTLSSFIQNNYTMNSTESQLMS
jgi:hypothetical protein